MPTTGDLVQQLIDGLDAATAELGDVKKAVRRDRRWVRFDIGLSVLGLIIAALLFFVLNGQAEQRHRQTVADHKAAVAQCKATDDARAGIRLANDTTIQVITSFFPPNAPPAALALLHQAEARYATANAAVPNLDCTKVP